MLASGPTSSAIRRVLLVDAVTWSPAYPASSPFRNVYQWYARWFSDLPHIQLIPLPAEENVLGAVTSGLDGVILSGSPRDAWTDDPVNHRLTEVVRHCQDQEIPLLGVCYGHQILARALGAKVGRHPEGLELGNTPVELTVAGQVSPLFAGFPERFDVLSSHADAVLDLPPGAELLARGRHTKTQAFSWGDRLFGVQFHPETDPETLRFLWNPRRETWRSRVRFDLDGVLDNLRPTPMAVNVLRNFVLRILT